MPLPTERTAPSLSAKTAKIMLFGPPGIGKTTLVADMDALILATEAGTGGISAYVQPVASWADFRQTAKELADDDSFSLIAVDTVDELYRMCQDHVTKEHNIKHPSDLDYGKGWQLVGDQFKLAVGYLCSQGRGVIFISHAKDEEVKQRIGSITKTAPTFSGAQGRWLMGFVDAVMYAGFDANGERTIESVPTENLVVKQRIKIASPIELSAAALTEALEQAVPLGGGARG